jgi:hypothetical protein
MKITNEIAAMIIFNDLSDEDNVKIVEEGKWKQDGKYQFKTTIFHYDSKFFSLTVSREGSPFTDWYYEWEDSDTFDCPEVEKVEVIKYEWKIKK